MTYIELLKQNEWHQKCQEILDRDKFRCQDCGCIGFHNKAGVIRLKSIEELDSFFPDWTYNGQPISRIIESLDLIEFEKIDALKDKQLFSIYQDAVQVVKIEKLLGKNTDYFKHPRAIYNFIMAYDNKQKLSSFEPVCGYTFFKKNGIAKINIPYSYTHILKFDKPITKGIYICFVGGNNSNEHGYINSEYEIGISYNKNYIHLSAVTNELLYKGLNIHHNYYVRGKKPWEYTNDALVTLCEDCHRKRHEKAIHILDSQLRYIKDMQICDRCGGSGYLPQYHHVEHGICFKCGGEGIILDDELL